jgi:hypothetical protein
MNFINAYMIFCSKQYQAVKRRDYENDAKTASDIILVGFSNRDAGLASSLVTRQEATEGHNARAVGFEDQDRGTHQQDSHGRASRYT